jgi:hypothetical protein
VQKTAHTSVQKIASRSESAAADLFVQSMIWKSLPRLDVGWMVFRKRAPSTKI